MVWTLGALSSLSTRSVLKSAPTAIVLMVALAETLGLAADVAVTVAAFVAPFAAAAGTATFTQTSVVPPAGRLEVVVMGVVQVESKKLTAQPAVVADMA